MAQDELTRILADRALRCADPARPTPRDIHAMETGGYHIPADEEPNIQPDTGRSTSCPEDAFDPGPESNVEDSLRTAASRPAFNNILSNLQPGDITAETLSEVLNEEILKRGSFSFPMFDGTIGNAFARIRFPDPDPAVNPKDLVGSTKLGLDLLPPGALCEVARVMALGAKKYGPYNWRDYPIQSRIYLGAMLRHLLQHSDGQDVDPESGALHLAHLAAGALILIDAMQQGTAVDTRPKSVGVVTSILERSRDGTDQVR